MLGQFVAIWTGVWLSVAMQPFAIMARLAGAVPDPPQRDFDDRWEREHDDAD